MKKILFVHHKLVCGGAENALFDLVQLLDKNKYDITVFVLNDGGEWEQKFRDADIKIINSYSELKEGKKIHNFILRKKVDNARKNRGRNLLSVATDEKYDLIISYHVPGAFSQTVTSADAKKIQYIHGDIETNKIYSHIFCDMGKSIDCFDKIICVSDVVRESFVKNMGYANKAITVYNPINNVKIKKLSEEVISENLPDSYICAVGRLSYEKGYARLIKIHKKLLDEGITNNLVIVGDGPDRKILEDLIKELQVEDSVFLLGYKANPYPYMKNSMFTVISSYTEGLPVTAMESVCLGVPVVSSYSGVKEIFGKECCGQITDNDDESLESGLKTMLINKELYDKALNGSKLRSKDFTKDKMITEVEQIFDHLLTEK